MKRLILSTFLILAFVSYLNAQETTSKNRKEKRAERQEKRMQQVKELLNEKTFVFKPTHAMPMGGGNIHLNYSFEAEVKGDTIFSYLPFYGVAYRVDYGSRKSAFDFTQPIQNYEMKEEDNGYLIQFDVKNGMDNLNFSLHISELGYATLNLISTNRQAISYYGRIESTEEN